MIEARKEKRPSSRKAAARSGVLAHKFYHIDTAGERIMSWQIDTVHSEVSFKVRHMMVSWGRGSFEKFGGTINIDEKNPENSTVDIQIDAASVNTRQADRDAHLRSPD